MIEALEIGISLALADGVSEGVTAARRDLRALEAAMTAGAVSVQKLRDAAAGASGMPPAVAGEAGKGAKPVPPVVPAGTAALAPASSPAVVMQVAQPAPAAAAAAVLTPRPAAAFPLARPTPGVPPSENAAGSPAQQAPQTLSAPTYVPQVAATPVRVSGEAGAPAVTILRMETQAPAGEAPSPQARGSGLSWSPAPPGGAGEAPPPWPAGRAAAVASAGIERAADSTSLAGGWMQPPSAQTAAAPVRVQQQILRAGDDNGRDARAQPTGSAPAAQAGEQARIEGDVFLDGTLVGRWMSNYLAREAGRASAGPTGFDARRNPLMPGATVGM